MSAHIERTIHPKNADESRTHLNKELIEFPDGIHSRSEAISHRINTAGITRKIGKEPSKGYPCVTHRYIRGYETYRG